MERTPSTTSIGFGAATEPVVEIGTPKTNVVPYGQRVFNICGFAIKCDHKRMALFWVRDRAALWLPFVATNPGQKWQTCVQTIEQMFVNDQIQLPEERLLEQPKLMIDSIQLVSISRLQLPNEEFVEQTIVSGHWMSSGKVSCCVNTERFAWYSIKDVIKQKNIKIWGKEVIEFARLLTKSDEELKRYLINISEVTNEMTYKYLSYNVNSGDITKQCIAESLYKTSVDREMVQRLHSSFTQHCYPSFTMSYTSYRQFMAYISMNPLNDNEIDKAFIAFDFDFTGFISFNEFLLGLIVLDPLSPNNDMRIAYIFRGYDKQSDGILDRSDLEGMVTDINKNKKQSTSIRTIEEQLNRMLTISGAIDSQSGISIEYLTKNIDSPQFKDIQLLFRSKISPIKQIAEQSIYQLIEKVTKPLNSDYLGTCPKHRVKDYKIATHRVQMNRYFRLNDVKDLRQTDPRDINFLNETVSVEMQRRHSIDVVNKKGSPPNQVIEIIREFGDILKSNQNSVQTHRDFNLIAIQSLTVDLIKTICEQVGLIFINEKRVLKIQSPAYVLGDIHGNLRDLMIFEDELWRTAPQCMASNLVFAGDYVDRGEYGIECILYLFAMKILNPIQVFLLRGNHEIRSIQRQFTFEKECNDKYKVFGPDVFESINRAFDLLPMAAIIDENIFCAHGGIPYSMANIDQMLEIPVPLAEPDVDAPAAWEMMWSDPMHQHEYVEHLKAFGKTDQKGFTENIKRGTAYFYSEEAVNRFLAVNQLSHIVRAHECFADGYSLFFDARLISVFSCSRYCGFNNKAAVVWIDGEDEDGVIRILSLDT